MTSPCCRRGRRRGCSTVCGRPSTVGTWLRSFTWAGVRQLDRVIRALLVRAWAAGLGPEPDDSLTIDVDSSIVETYGLAKQGGARFGYTGVRGYHPLVASLADTGELLHTRLRGGTAASGRGAATFVAETISRVRSAGARGTLTLRADSGFYAGAVVSACRRAEVAFSVTARKNTAIRKAIDAIPDDAWTPIPYWLDGGADVAETTYTAFAGTRHEVTARLLVRRVRPTPGSQLGHGCGVRQPRDPHRPCLLYTSDAADDLTRVDLGGRRIIKKKKK